MQADPEQIMLNMQPGSAICTALYAPEESVKFLVREKSSVIRDKIKDSIITLRSGLFIQNGIGLLLMMFLICPDVKHIFEIWIDYCQPDKRGEQLFNLMSTQENIYFRLYGDSLNVEKLIQIDNGLSSYFMAAPAQIRKLKPWKPADYASELKTICRKYVSPEDGWYALFLHSEGN